MTRWYIDTACATNDITSRTANTITAAVSSGDKYNNYDSCEHRVDYKLQVTFDIIEFRDRKKPEFDEFEFVPCTHSDGQMSCWSLVIIISDTERG